MTLASSLDIQYDHQRAVSLNRTRKAVSVNLNIPMAHSEISDHQLLSYLDEMLPIKQMADVEKALRKSQSLKGRLTGLSHRRDQGAHSVGEVWRRERLSCPSRQELGSYLLGTMAADAADYLDFHIWAVGCRLCAANLYDLEQSSESTQEAQSRRRKFFQSSAGYLQSAGDES
jgi:hypothetical protein